jgi:hypothetical protein
MNRSESNQSPIEFEARLILAPAVPVGYGPGVIGPGYPTPVPGADPALLASAISIGHAMKQVLDPGTLRTRSGRTYKGRNWQPRNRKSEFKPAEFEQFIKEFISILGRGPAKPYFADPALAHLPPPIGKKPKHNSRKSRKNRKPEGVPKAKISGLSHDDIIEWLSVPFITEDKADVDMAEPGTSYKLQNALHLILDTEKVADREAKDEEEYKHFVLAHTNGTLDDETLF